MKRIKQLGVTLLEIMLVLAIAAMVLVMSIRYYQSANSSAQSNALLATIQGVVAASDSLAQGSDFTAATTTAVQNVLGGSNKLNSPWGAITLAPTTTTVVMTIPQPPTSVCTILTQQIKQNPKLTNLNATCTSLTYDSTK